MVAGDASRLFEETAQFLGLCLDDTRDHPLLDDGVGARPQSRAEEEIDHVAAAHALPIEEIAGFAAADDHALDRDLGESPPGAGHAAVGVVEDELDARARQGLSLVRAVEDHVGHLLAAQGGGAHLAEHPAHGVDHVRFAAAVGPDDAHQRAREHERGRLDEGLETGQFDLDESHGVKGRPMKASSRA